MKDLFSESNIKLTYFGNVRYKSSSVGNDFVTRDNFDRNIHNNFTLISKKCTNETYNFTPYKGLLLIKKYDEAPRIIAVASIRDKIVLTILKNHLQKNFPEIKQELVQTKIQSIKKELPNYSYFLKIDIRNFFGTIDHSLLYSKVNARVAKPLTTLILKAINTPIKNRDLFEDRRHINDKRGLPQGIPISNILAEIYLLEFDRKLKNKNQFKYFRYVDDILIMHNEEDINTLKAYVMNLINDLKLEINDSSEKTRNHCKNDSFNYLGYSICNGKLSVKKASRLKHEKSLENLFKIYYKKKYNLDRFVFELNLKITGFKFDNKKYGWIFFFSQIDDLQVLCHLDNYVKILIKRFNISISPTKIKTYLRSYNEILYNLNSTSYIPNFTNLDTKEKKRILYDIYEINIENLSDETVNFHFSRIISNIAKSHEKDVQGIS